MTSISSFTEAHAALRPYIELNTTAERAYTLERMKDFMEKLGNPQNNFKIIHVAGTSGKTSTSYYVASFLQQAGCRVGLTVSPHLDEINDRLQINLLPLPEPEYCKVLGEFLDIVQSADIQITYFELLVAMAYWYFAREGVDYAVIEVGLGGLLDATNVINRADKICVITDIGLDHVHILGKTIGEITAHKAGIIQPYNHVFMYRQEATVRQAVMHRAKDQHATLHELEQSAEYLDFVSKLPDFQKRNWQLAAQIYDYAADRDKLHLLGDGQMQATVQTYIPGRMEILSSGGKTIILDGAHNPQKMTALVNSLNQLYPDQPAAALVAFKASKDVAQTLQVLTARVDYLITTQIANDGPLQKHSALSEQLQTAIANNVGSQHIIPLDAAIDELLKRQEPVLVITGSLYILHAARQHIQRRV